MEEACVLCEFRVLSGLEEECGTSPGHVWQFSDMEE